MEFLDTIKEARRRSLLSGQPLTSQEMRGMSRGWFSNEAVLSNARRAQAEKEKQAQDRLAMEQRSIEDQKKAARMQQITGTIGSVAKDAVATLGKDYISKPAGESMVAKGASAIKNIFSPGALEAPTGAVGESMFAGADLAEGALNIGRQAGGMMTETAGAGIEAGAAGGTTAGGTTAGSLVGSVAGPVAIIGAAEAVKKNFGGQSIGWGGKNNDWNDKSVVEQMTSAPGTAGGVVPFVPGALLDRHGLGGKFIKVMADAERIALKPIDWLFGDK